MIKICILVAFLSLGAGSDFDPTKHRNWKLLPHDTCGQVSSSRIIGGEEAPMNSYPWIARIGYKDSEPPFRCGGVVVNSKTILTAAHCVTQLPDNSTVDIVRLGEHDVTTDPDCKDNVCADPVVDIKVSEVLFLKTFNDPLFKDDIAILRLAEEIKFSSFIKPICLTGGELFRKDYVGTEAEAAGWGIYDIRNPGFSAKLQVVKLPILNTEECKSFKQSYSNVGPTQLCVGGVVGKDSCGGDSGGPLMKVDDGLNGPQYYLLGIVSFGSKKCGDSNMPGIYTKVSSFMKWFLDNLVGKPDRLTELVTITNQFSREVNYSIPSNNGHNMTYFVPFLGY